MPESIATAQVAAEPITLALPVSILEALPVLKRACNTRAYVPILANLHIASDGQNVHLRATDLEVTAQYSVALDEPVEPFATTVPLVPFLTAVKNGTSIRLTVHESRVVLDVDGAKRELRTMPAADFLPMPDVKVHASSQMAFRDSALGVARSARCASDEQAKGSLMMGTQLAARSGELYACSTDGYRLNYVAIGKTSDADFEVVLPGALTHVLAALRFGKKTPAIDASVYVNEVKTLVRIDAGPWSFVARAVDGQYPNWRGILPKYTAGAARIVVDRKQFIDVLKLASRAASGKAKLVSLETVKTASAGDTLRIAAKNDDEGSFAGSVAAETQWALAKPTHFNGQFFAEILESLTAEKVFIVVDGYAPTTVYDGAEMGARSWALIMPVRIK